jgi:hypothetical protein
MKPPLALLAFLALAGCQSTSPETTANDGPFVGCPADVSQADRYKYPDCDTPPAQAAQCPVDVSEADRAKYPACN